MISFLNTYLDNEYKLTSIYKDKVFVFERDGEYHLSQSIKPSDDSNKNFIGINSLKEATDLFIETSKFYKNISCFDYILTSQVTPQSRIKFYEYIKEVNKNNTKIIFCGLKKLRDKL